MEYLIHPIILIDLFMFLFCLFLMKPNKKEIVSYYITSTKPKLRTWLEFLNFAQMIYQLYLSKILISVYKLWDQVQSLELLTLHHIFCSYSQIMKIDSFLQILTSLFLNLISLLLLCHIRPSNNFITSQSLSAFEFLPP